jgi:subtilisin family serine protease
VRLAASDAPEAELAGTAAVDARRAEIAAVQSALEDELAGAQAVPLRRYATIPYAALEVGPDGLSALERSSLVLGIAPERASRPTLAVAGPLQGADQAWAAVFAGSGQTVAVLDTGTDRNHPFFAGRIVAEACRSRRTSASTWSARRSAASAGRSAAKSPTAR